MKDVIPDKNLYIQNNKTIQMKDVIPDKNLYIQNNKTIQMKDVSLWNLSFTKNDLSDTALLEAKQ